MNADQDFDLLLATLLAPPDDLEDPAFVAGTMQLVAAQQALRRQRQRLAHDWLSQMAALTGLLVGLALFSRLPVFAVTDRTSLLAIASPLVLVLALWLFASGGVTTSLRPTQLTSR